MPVLARSLYLYENLGVEAHPLLKRDLYLYENRGVQAHPELARALYLYENRAIYPFANEARSLYLYEAKRDGEVFPWLAKIAPTQQYRGGTVDLFGDGFGELLEVAADATPTTSSVSGGNIGTNAIDRTSAAWVSTSGAAAWLRLTWGTPQIVSAIALEGLASSSGTSWGRPRFRFSDAGADVDGAAEVPADDVDAGAEYPVGLARALYQLPAPRTVTWIEVAIVPATGSGTNRGLSEVWVYTDTDQAAEGSAAILNDGLIIETGLGIVSWRNRSPGLWPANGGLPMEKAATVTLPSNAESGLVIVEETI